MRFEASRVLQNGETGPDPADGPIGRDKLHLLNPRDPGSDVPNQAVTFFLAAPSSESVVIDLWGVREDKPAGISASTPEPVPSDRFALISAGLEIPGATLIQLYLKGIAGAVYAEVMSETITDARTLFAAGCPNVETPVGA